MAFVISFSEVLIIPSESGSVRFILRLSSSLATTTVEYSVIPYWVASPGLLSGSIIVSLILSEYSLY